MGLRQRGESGGGSPLRFGLAFAMLIGLLAAACTPPPPPPEVIHYFTPGGAVHPDAPALVTLDSSMDLEDAIDAVEGYTRQWSFGDLLTQAYIVEGLVCFSGCEPWPAPEDQTPSVNNDVITYGTDTLVVAINQDLGPWSASYDPALGLLVEVIVDYGGGSAVQYRLETLTLP